MGKNIKKNCDAEQIIKAAKDDDIKALKKALVQKDADVNAKDGDGRTPLMWACLNGNRGMVKLLLKNAGIKINEKETRGITALMFAAYHGHDKIVQYLLARKEIDVNINSQNQENALYMASANGNIKIVEYWFIYLTRLNDIFLPKISSF